MECYDAENERFNYEKTLFGVPLDPPLKLVISATKFAVEHYIAKRIKSIAKKLHLRKDS